MNRIHKALFLCSLIIIFSCKTKISKSTLKLNNNLLEQILESKPALFTDILKNKENYNVQIVFTQIDRDKNNKPHFTEHQFNVQHNNYFYPASTVKMPAAFLALEKLNEINISELHKNSILVIDSNSSKQTVVYTQPNSLNGIPSIANYIKQIFMVSDNDAYNRLYEFLGQETFNQKLHSKGYTNAEILHRLELALTPEQNRKTNPYSFYSENGNIIYTQKEQVNNKLLPDRNDFLGKGYISKGVLINSPMNFSGKNRIYIDDLHHMLMSVVFPENFSAKQKFNISENDRLFLLRQMSGYPIESDLPLYKSTNYWDTYVKFLFYGSEKIKPNSSLRIFNKVGDAYGHLLDIAYFVDFDTKTEFFLSAVIYCNTDGILNDDKYDYDSTGLPFMKNLGKTILDFEKSRKKKYLPNLSNFKFDYSKQYN